MLLRLLISLLPSLVLGDVVRLASSSCLSDPAASNQLLNFTDFFGQLDTQWQAPVTGETAGYHTMLKIAAFGMTGIEQTGYSNVTNYLATLIAESSILNFEPHENQSSLCVAITSPANPPGCPFGPGEVAIGQKVPLKHSYPFTTLTTRLTVLDTSTPPKQLACFDVRSTTYLSTHFLYKLVLWLTAGGIIFYALLMTSARLYAAVTTTRADLEATIAASLTTKIAPTTFWHKICLVASQWASGRDVIRPRSLVRFASPTVTELLSWMQFFVLLSMCAVEWPDFIYPIFAKALWSTLVFDLSYLSEKNTIPTVNMADDAMLPVDYGARVVDPASAIYLNPSLSNNLLNIHNIDRGLPSLARSARLQDKDLFTSCASIMLMLASGISLLAAFVWAVTHILNSRHHHTAVADAENVNFDESETRDSVEKDSKSRLYSENKSSFVQHAKSSTGSSDDERKLAEKARRKVTFWKDGSKSYESHTEDATPSALWMAFIQGNILRLLLAFHLPLTVYSVYQFSYGSSTVLSALAALTFAILCVILPCAAIFRVWQHRTVRLLEDQRLLLKYGSLYNIYAGDSLNYCLLRVAINLIEGIVVGAGQRSGSAQVIVLLMVEVTDTVFTSFWLPWHEGAAMAPISFVVSVLRIICTSLLLAISPLVNLSFTATNWVTYVILLLQAVILVFIYLLIAIKFLELLVRLFGHVHFEYGRSARADGLLGAIRKLDRNSTASTRKSKRRKREKALATANAISEGKNLSHQRQVMPSEAYDDEQHESDRFIRSPPQTSRSTSRYSVGTTGRSGIYHDEADSRSGYFVRANTKTSPLDERDEGHIMSAWSGQPRSPTHPSILPGQYSHQRPSVTPGLSGTSEESDHTHYSSHVLHSPSVSGFAVLRGGRASDASPYTITRQHYPPSGHSSADYFANATYPSVNHRPRAKSQSASIEYASSPNPSSSVRDSMLVLSNSPSHVKLQSMEEDPKLRTHTVPKRKNKGLLGNLLARRSGIPMGSESDFSTDDDSDFSADEEEVAKRTVQKKRMWAFGRKRKAQRSTGTAREVTDEDGEEEEWPSDDLPDEGTPEQGGSSFVVMRPPRPKSPILPALRHSAVPVSPTNASSNPKRMSASAASAYGELGVAEDE